MPLLPEGPIDTLGVLDHLLATPEAVAAARDAEVEVPPFAGVHGTVLLATGADVEVARAAQALVQPWSPVPVFVHTGHRVPAFVSDEWRVVLVSSRGDAPGALATAHDQLAGAVDHRAVLTAVGSGEVVDAVAEAGGAVVTCPVDAPAARYAFAPTLVSLLRLLDGLGAISTPLGGPGLPEALDAAVEQLTRRRDQVGAEGEPARLARRIGRTLVLAQGHGPLGQAAAARLAATVSDDAKVAAFATGLPEQAAHALSGWGQHGDVTRQVFTLVGLRHDHEHDADAAVAGRVDELLEEVVASRLELRAEGRSPLAQLLDLVLVGDLLAWHLAQVNEIDPGPSGVAL